MGWGAGGSCTPRPPIRQQTAQETRVITVVFLGLLLDLLAFTLLLPLLPGLLESHGRAHDPLYGSWQRGVDWFAAAIRMPAEKRSDWLGLLLPAVPLGTAHGGGLGLSGEAPGDAAVPGLATSYAVWAASRSFAAFLASRVIGGISKGNVSLSTAIVADLGSPSARSRGMAVIGVAFSLGFTLGPMLGASLPAETVPWLALLFAASDLLFIFCFLPETLPPEKRPPGRPLQSCPRPRHPPSPPGSKPLWICSAPWPCSVSRPWPAARTHLLETTWEPSPPGPGVFPLPLPVLGPRVHPELPCPSALPVQQPAAGKDVFLHRPHHGHRAGCLRAEDQPWRGDCSCEAGHPAARARLPPHRLGAHAACAGLGVAAVLLRCRSRGALPVLCGCQLWLAQAEGHDHGHPAEPGRPGQGGGTHGGCLSVLAGGGQGLLHCVLWPLPAPPPAPVESEASSPRTQGRVAEPAPPRAGGEEAWAGDPPSPWAQPRTAQGLQPQRARDTHGPSLGVDGPVGLGAVTPNPSRLSLGFSLSDSVSQASE
ncbi:major facilitator superfamily domain-containing protein 10 isoform X2 [Neomonachus schauinslandi]|uniref:Major facilitator superfamily domain-containing protein 10 isoform X2 n=1 Tax=Neomonachus schauinslandi TaxID=29088 RepID=A0A2Y9G2J7_NEOSC|nr:major facilitator superfamily domain-containing protein 10 isoform X2 [Neomonachus schauinslandi]